MKLRKMRKATIVLVILLLSTVAVFATTNQFGDFSVNRFMGGEKTTVFEVYDGVDYADIRLLNQRIVTYNVIAKRSSLWGNWNFDRAQMSGINLKFRETLPDAVSDGAIVYSTSSLGQGLYLHQPDGWYMINCTKVPN